MTRRGRWVAGALVALGLLLVVTLLARAPLLRRVGEALVVNDPLRPADAIVVLAGGTPLPEHAAAALFKQGFAPRVVLSRPVTPARARALVKLGIRPLDSQGEAQAALEKFGVPPAAVLALSQPVHITEAELRVVHEAARAGGYRRVILVTSAEHTRRVKLIWRRQLPGDVEAVVRPVPDDRSVLDGWWRNRRLAEAVLHEYLGIAAVSLGISHWMQ